MALGAEGSIYLGGQEGNASIDDLSDMFIVKYDAAGSLLWTATYPSAGPTDDAVQAIAVGADGGIVATGVAGADYLTVKLSPDGVRLWAAAYRGGRGSQGLLEGRAGDAFAGREEIDLHRRLRHVGLGNVGSGTGIEGRPGSGA